MSKKRTPEQQRKLREKRRRLRSNKKKLSKQKTPQKIEFKTPKINTTKWIKIGKEIMNENVHSIVKNYIKDKKNLIGKYSDRNDLLIDVYPKNGDEWGNTIKNMLSKVTNTFIKPSITMNFDDDLYKLIQMDDEGLMTGDELVKQTTTIDNSYFYSLSKKKKKIILEGLLEQHKSILNLIEDLNSIKKEGGIKQFKTQKIDINNTNVWSCFDDFTYGFLDWMWEDREVILQCISKPVYGRIVQRFYTWLGNPNNQLERDKGSLENLLNMIENDDELLGGFRSRVYGYQFKQNENILSNELNNWFDIPLINEFYNEKDSEVNHTRMKTINHTMVTLVINNESLFKNDLESLSNQLIINGEYETPEDDIGWLSKKKDDDLISIYRSISDKNHPMGWSWTTNKKLSLGWIRGRGLVEDNKKQISYVVETQIPKKDVLHIINSYNEKDGGNIYNEVIVTKEKLKKCDLKITDVDGSSYKKLYDMIMSDEIIKKNIIQSNIMYWIQLFKDKFVSDTSYDFKDLNEKWFIKRSWRRFSLGETEQSLNKKYNPLTESWV